jgi:hypothetical protein
MFKIVNNITEYKAPEYSNVSYSLMMVKYDRNKSDKYNQGCYVICIELIKNIKISDHI